MIEALKSNMLLLKFNRNWVDGEDSFKLLTTLLAITNAAVQIFMLYALVKKICESTDDLVVAMFCIWAICLIGPCIGKLWGLIHHGDVLRKILTKLEFELLLEYSIDQDEKQHIKDAEKLISKYLKGYIWLTFMGTLATISVPLWKKIFSYIDLYPKDVFVGFPFPAWSPFDEESYIGYTVEFIIQCYFFFSLWTVWLGADVLFAGIILHLCGHFKIIEDRIAKWKYCSTLEPLEVDENKKNLKRIILYHAEVLKLGRNLNETLSLSNILQLFCITIIICCCGMQIISASSEVATHIFVMFFIIICMTTSWLVVCFVGNKISSESEKVGEALYFVDWIDLTSKERRDICYMIFRAQNPLCMTCGKFFKISLNLFLDMVKMSYSLLAVLKRVTD